MIKRWVNALLGVVVAGGLLAGVGRAQETPAVSPEARLQLERMTEAYGKLDGFSVRGQFSAELDIAGQTSQETKQFEASYGGPLKFRHEIKDEMLLGGTGRQVYVYSIAEKAYLQAVMDTSASSTPPMPAPMPQILRAQNPALWMVLTKSPVDELTRNSSRVSVVAPTEIDGTSYPTVQIDAADGSSLQLATDPSTHLLRRMIVDLRRVFEARGAVDVKTARLVVDYGQTAPGVPANADFSWTPPADARDLSAENASGQPNAAAAAPAAALEGLEAPNFTLKDEAGKEVTLAELRGSVVVLDFWATWCPPCVEGLPALEAMAKERAERGLKVLAVNVQEDARTVARFKERTGLGLPVLFDSEGAVAGLYKVTGIPQTVVIDRAGVVRKVLVGFGPQTKSQLAEAVDAALATN